MLSSVSFSSALFSSSLSMRHPGLQLYVWACVLMLVQTLSAWPLLLAALIVFAFAWTIAGARVWRLVRRVRWLLLTLVCLFAFFTAGEALWSSLPALSPTREGLLLAAEHAGRLLAAVAAVAILLERLTPAALVSGVYALMRPLRALCASAVPVERMAVRAMLVLHFVDAAPARGWREWLLDETGDDASHSLRLERWPMTAAGWSLALLASGALVGVAWMQGRAYA